MVDNEAQRERIVGVDQESELLVTTEPLEIRIGKGLEVTVKLRHLRRETRVVDQAGTVVRSD